MHHELRAWHEYRENVDERTVYVAGSDDEPEEEQIVDDDLFEGYGAQESAKEEEQAVEDAVVEAETAGEDPNVAVLADEPDPPQEEANVEQQRASTAVQNPERDNRAFDCPGCGTMVFQKMFRCNLCDELLVIEHDAQHQTAWMERRLRALETIGLNSLRAAVMHDLDDHQRRNLRQNIEAARGATSIEADTIKEANRKLKRALSLGFTSIADRYEVDGEFHLQMARLGRTFHDMEMQDLFTQFHLASPPRDRVQIAFGMALYGGSSSLLQ